MLLLILLTRYFAVSRRSNQNNETLPYQFFFQSRSSLSIQNPESWLHNFHFQPTFSTQKVWLKSWHYFLVVFVIAAVLVCCWQYLWIVIKFCAMMMKLTINGLWCGFLWNGFGISSSHPITSASSTEAAVIQIHSGLSELSENCVKGH